MAQSTNGNRNGKRSRVLRGAARCRNGGRVDARLGAAGRSELQTLPPDPGTGSLAGVNDAVTPAGNPLLRSGG